ALIGPEVEGVLPALLKGLGDENVQSAVIEAFRSFKELPRAALRKALKSDNLNSRAGAAILLYGLEKEREQATPVLLEALAKATVPGRKNICRELVGQRIATPAVLDALAKGLAREEEPQAEEFARTLGLLGTEARPAVKALTAALKSSNKDVRRESAIALSYMDRKAVDAIPVLLEAVRQEDAFRTLPCRRALLRFGTPAVEGLVKLLGDRTFNAQARPGRIGGPGGMGAPGVRRGTTISPRAGIATLLGELGEEAKSAIPALKEALKEPDRSIRVAAAE